MTKTVTLTSMLREMAQKSLSPTAKQLSAKLDTKLSMRQCYVLHQIATGGTLDEFTPHARHDLRHRGLVESYPCPLRTRSLNGKVKTLYRLTEAGEAAHAEILSKFTPIVDRINLNAYVEASVPTAHSDTLKS
jgi:hypothetical protein